MTPEQFKHLRRGDLVRNTGSGNAYVVDGHYGKAGVVLVNTCLAMNSSEWDLVNHAGEVIPVIPSTIGILPFFGYFEEPVRDVMSGKQWTRRNWFAIYDTLQLVLISKDWERGEEWTSITVRATDRDEVLLWVTGKKRIPEEEFYEQRNSAFPWN